MRSIPLPLVRARGRALQNCVRTVQGQSECFSIGEKPSGSGRLRARRRLFHWRGPPKAPRQWQSRWIAHAPRANRFAVRAPCAHPRKSIGKALGKALPKTRRHRRGGGKVSASTSLSPVNGNGLLKVSASATSLSHPVAPQKACASRQTFFNFFLDPPCALPSLLLNLPTSAMGRAFRRGAG